MNKFLIATAAILATVLVLTLSYLFAQPSGQAPKLDIGVNSASQPTPSAKAPIAIDIVPQSTALV